MITAEKSRNFEQAKKSLEIQRAQQILDQLKRWKTANATERQEILNNPVCEELLTRYGYTADELIWRLDKAIKVYDYKPNEETIFDFAMERDFDYMPIYTPEQDIEMNDAIACLDLLQEYTIAKTQQEKDNILAKLNKYDPRYSEAITKYNILPVSLFIAIIQAIGKNKYRPKNMDFTSFVFSPDLKYINGSVDTFDSQLSHTAKNYDKPKIRDTFTFKTAQRFVLAKQFANDWILRMQKHPELVEKARNAPLSDTKPYTELFSALAADFCDDYHIPHSAVRVIVTNDEKKFDSNNDGYHVSGYIIPKWSMHLVSDKDLEEFHKNPSKFPLAKKCSTIYLNPSKISHSINNQDDLLDKVTSIFAHEMNHDLDHLMPSQGALGAQVQRIDSDTYTDADTDRKEYHKSATELSSYETEKILLERLHNLKNV